LCFRTVQILVYAGIGTVLAGKGTPALDYRSLLRLSSVAVTPVVIVRTLLWLGPWEPRWYLRWPIAIVVTLLYLRFGIRAASEGAANTASAAGVF
jgi:hypothetical protein